MTAYEQGIDIDASPAAVWTVLVDVAGWPTWSRSILGVTLLEPGPLAVGSRVRVKQPRLPALVWTVDGFEPGRFFSWTSTSAGTTSTAGHRLVDRGTGCHLRLDLVQSGLLAPVSGLLLGGLTRHYLHLEAAGLKGAVEGST